MRRRNRRLLRSCWYVNFYCALVSYWIGMVRWIIGCEKWPGRTERDRKGRGSILLGIVTGIR